MNDLPKYPTYQLRRLYMGTSVCVVCVCVGVKCWTSAFLPIRYRQNNSASQSVFPIEEYNRFFLNSLCVAEKFKCDQCAVHRLISKPVYHFSMLQPLKDGGQPEQRLVDLVLVLVLAITQYTMSTYSFRWWLMRSNTSDKVLHVL